MNASVNNIFNNELNRNETFSGKHSQVEDVPAIRETEIHYYTVRENEDLFPHVSNLDPLNYDQKEDIDHDMYDLLQQANQNGLTMEKRKIAPSCYR